MRKLGLTLAAAAAAIGVFGAAPASAVYPPEEDQLILSDSVVGPGEEFQAEFVGCTVGETVAFVFVGETTTATCQNPSATVTLTAPTIPGQYEIVATGLTSGRTATATLTVVGPTPGTAPAAAPAAGLPATGSDSQSTVQTAAALVAVGAGLTIVGIRRHRVRAG